MGAQHVSFLLPNRFEFGYGLSPEIVLLAKQQSPDLIITVDNGVASVAGVEKAHELGIKVLVTDHHLPPDSLPNADALVNPNLKNDKSGCENLAGVGVIFYVMLALRKRLQSIGWFEKIGLLPPNLTELLDLVALGTVADVVKLDRINRILVEQGMRRIRANKTRAGIRALLQVAGKSQHTLCASDIGFGLGPRLNAAGRLSDMTIGVECLLSETDKQAQLLAQRLDELNKERRSIENEMREEAEVILSQRAEPQTQDSQSSLCLYEPHWHQGVVGILASRIKDQLHRPVIVFASEDGQNLKGSGRSIPGVHLRDALDSVASANPGLIEKFGGHAMAAGLSLSKAEYERFKSAFDAEIARRLDGVTLDKQWLSDGDLPTELFTLTTAEQLRYLAPWGQGFPEPLFDSEFSVLQSRVVGVKHTKLCLSPDGGQTFVDAIAFNQTPSLSIGETIRAVYKLDINEFRGQSTVQLMVEHIVQ
jgi:single-stranded-DNA-specific exonuclease